jgi:hypothetical protein
MGKEPGEDFDQENDYRRTCRTYVGFILENSQIVESRSRGGMRKSRKHRK